MNDAPPRERPLFWQALPRFAAVGLVGVAVDVAVVWLLHGLLGLPLLVSTTLATEVAIVGNYVGNELFTFHYKRLHLGRLLRFNAASLGGLCLKVATIWVLQHMAPWHYLIDEVIGIGVGAAANFALNFGWTWGARRDRGA